MIKWCEDSENLDLHCITVSSAADFENLRLCRQKQMNTYDLEKQLKILV